MWHRKTLSIFILALSCVIPACADDPPPADQRGPVDLPDPPDDPNPPSGNEPEIDSVSPDVLPSDGMEPGTANPMEVTINGDNFEKDTEFFFFVDGDQVAGEDPVFVSPMEFRLTAPALNVIIAQEIVVRAFNGADESDPFRLVAVPADAVSILQRALARSLHPGQHNLPVPLTVFNMTDAPVTVTDVDIDVGASLDPFLGFFRISILPTIPAHDFGTIEYRLGATHDLPPDTSDTVKATVETTDGTVVSTVTVPTGPRPTISTNGGSSNGGAGGPGGGALIRSRDSDDDGTLTFGALPAPIEPIPQTGTSNTPAGFDIDFELSIPGPLVIDGSTTAAAPRPIRTRCTSTPRVPSSSRGRTAASRHPTCSTRRISSSPTSGTSSSSRPAPARAPTASRRNSVMTGSAWRPSTAGASI